MDSIASVSKRTAAIGKPLRRKEDDRLLRGVGRFTDDFSLPGQTYAVMVRSPHPHARIRSIDIQAAREMPGVLGVFTGLDVARDGISPIPHNPIRERELELKMTAPGGGKPFIGPHMLLPADKARHVGEAVAMVVAETLSQAHDAAEAVDVDYEELPWVTDAKLAASPGAPKVWNEVADNICVDSLFGNFGATETAFAKAAHTISREFHIQRVTGVPLEPRAALAHYDSASGKYTLYAGSGGAVRQKREIAHVLGIEESNLRVVAFDVGGNFGTRNRVYVEFGLVLWAAEKVRRPIKYRSDRSEAFLSDYQGRDLWTKVELALDANGKILALRASNLSNLGARMVSLSPLAKGSALITGAYDIPVACLRSRAVFTNTPSTQPYRSSGRPEVTFAIERLLDAAANEYGFDRVELRRKNLVRPEQMPYANAIGALYDSGEYEAAMDAAMRIADWNGFAQRKEEAKKRGRLLGRGIANYVESSAGTPRERAEITVKPGGTIDLVIGTQPSGQGHETSFSQVAADALGVPFESVNIILGDTDIVSVGGGSHSGRSMRHAGAVITLAAQDIIAKAKRMMAYIYGAAESDVAFAGGLFTIAHTNISLDFFELAHEASKRDLPADLKDGLAVVRDNEMTQQVYPNGCAVCEVEVDADSGVFQITRYAAVDDVGRCINPLIVHGQTHGAAVQGIGQAIGEECYIDPKTGQPLTGSFMDYTMPRADHFPMFTVEIKEVLSPTNPLGVKSGGEGGTTPALAVIVSAVTDALKEYGVRDIQMPLTPLRVWTAIQDAKQKAGS